MIRAFKDLAVAVGEHASFIGFGEFQRAIYHDVKRGRFEWFNEALRQTGRKAIAGPAIFDAANLHGLKTNIRFALLYSNCCAQLGLGILVRNMARGIDTTIPHPRRDL